MAKLHGFTPEDEPWFLPALYDLIQKHTPKNAITYAMKSAWPIYNLELYIKSGLREVSKSLLLDFAQSQKEDDVYAAALSLAICGHEEGFKLLEQFTRRNHRLSRQIDPLTDILPDLKFIDDSRALELEKWCKINIPSVLEALEQNEENEIVKSLRFYMNDHNELTEVESKALLEFEAHTYELLGMIGVLTQNMPRILLGKCCSDLFILQTCKAIRHSLKDIESVADLYLEQTHSDADYYVYKEVMLRYPREKLDEHGNLLEKGNT
jgi:hypothetical protein